MNLHILTPLVAAFLAGSAHATGISGLIDDFQAVYRDGKASHVVDIDNDTLLLNQRDGYYSSGLRYTYKSTFATTDETRTAGWRLGQEMYTPSDIKLPAAMVAPPDRPYAGWLYAGAFHEVHRRDGSSARYGFDVGCLGPCAGGESTQTVFHRILRQPLPQGWSRQIRNEVGVVLYADIAPVSWRLGSNIDVTPSLKGRFGNIFTDVGGGVLARAGRLNTLPGESAFYAYARSDAYLVAYNATLQGGYFSKNNPHTVAPKRIVGEAELGVAWSDGPYGVRAGVVRRTNEIRDLPNSVGSQNYVRLQFVYAP